MADFVLYKEDVERIQKSLSHLLTESAATYVMLINKDGNLIAHVGFNSSIDATSLVNFIKVKIMSGNMVLALFRGDTGQSNGFANKNFRF